MKNLLIVFVMTFVFGHGEDKPGPHGGYIRMPGSFHTEIVPESEGQMKVYLLDMNWKNPTIKDSQVTIKLVSEKVSQIIECREKVDYFLCQIPKGSNLKSGKLFVNATREKAVGGEASYPLPLSFGLSKEHGVHGGH